MDFPESDWKTLRRVHAVALKRFCERVLDECEALLKDSSGSAHDRYLRLFQHLQSRDRSLAWAFDDMRRSRAVERLAGLIGLDVVTADELAQFSPDVRAKAELIATLHADSDE